MKHYDFQIVDPSRGIPAEIQKSWKRLQNLNSNLWSPFFAPEFTEIVSRACDRVEVAMWRERGEIVAIFPFERRSLNFSGPVGGFLSDYDGVIAHPNFDRDPSQILRDCRLVAWDFHHSPDSDRIFSPSHRVISQVALTHIQGGFADFIKERRAAGNHQISEYMRKMRKLEQDVGPLRFVPHSRDETLLEKLMMLKSAQYWRNRWRDIFAIPWVQQVLRSIHQAQSPEFAGMLCALYAGEHLVALHFGIRSRALRHSWFPTYDMNYSKYSPGILLTLKLLESCPNLGIRTIDWGSGEHQHKQLVVNAFMKTGSGSVELPCVATWVRRLCLPMCNMPSKARSLLGKTQLGTAALRVREWLGAQ